METRGPKLKSSELLCLSWLPATLMMIWPIRPVAGQGSLPETRCSFLKHFSVLYPFIPNTIQINQRLCNNWHLRFNQKKSVSLILRSCTGIGTVLRKMFRLGSIVMNKIHWKLCKKTEIVKHLSQNFYIKILSLWPSGLGMVPYKILGPVSITMPNMINPSKASQKQTL